MPIFAKISKERDRRQDWRDYVNEDPDVKDRMSARELVPMQNGGDEQERCENKDADVRRPFFPKITAVKKITPFA
jgi:hypothetical protein